MFHTLAFCPAVTSQQIPSSRIIRRVDFLRGLFCAPHIRRSYQYGEKQMHKKVRFEMYIPKYQRDALMDRARKTDVSIAHLIRQAIAVAFPNEQQSA